MDVRAMKHAAKLSEWRERILACRTSGIPVKAWCAENKVSIKSYYRWERLYMAEAGSKERQAAVIPKASGQLVRIDPERLPEREGASIPVTAVESIPNDRITLRYGGMSVELPVGVGVKEIAALIKALEQPC